MNGAGAQAQDMQMVNYRRWIGGVLLIFTLQICLFWGGRKPGCCRQGWSSSEGRQGQEAEALLRAASAADPNSASLHGALGELLFKERNYEGCIAELNVAVGMDPDSRKYTILASPLIGTQRFGVACHFYEARSRFDDYFQLHYDLGLAYYFMNKIAEAQAEFEESYLADHLRPLLSIAACFLAKGDSPHAVELLRKMVKERPNNAIYWGTLGRTLGQMGDENKAEAARACRRALALKPNYLHLQFDAGQSSHLRLVISKKQALILEHSGFFAPRDTGGAMCNWHRFMLAWASGILPERKAKSWLNSLSRACPRIR